MNDEMKTNYWTGDCISIMAGMPTKSVDVLLTDPPYPNPCTPGFRAASVMGTRLVPGHEEGQKARRSSFWSPRFPLPLPPPGWFQVARHIWASRMPRATRPTKRSWYGAGITSGSGAKSGMCPSSTIGRCRTCRITDAKTGTFAAVLGGLVHARRRDSARPICRAQNDRDCRARNSSATTLRSNRTPSSPRWQRNASTSEHCVTTNACGDSRLILTLRKQSM